MGKHSKWDDDGGEKLDKEAKQGSSFFADRSDCVWRANERERREAEGLVAVAGGSQRLDVG